MFYIIGLGLGDAEDITMKGFRIIKKCERIYLESYTSILTVGKEALEKYYETELILADREMVEQSSDEILKDADVKDVAFLVVGDPFGATTHADIILRAREAGIPYEVVHNASIMNACGCCGLQLYSFGETISIPFWTDSWQPDSFYSRIIENKLRGLHTLCLLDIKVKEPTLDSLTRKKKEYMPPRFMSVNEAATQLLEILEKKEIADQGTVCMETVLACIYIEWYVPVVPSASLDKDLKCIGLARVGSKTQQIVFCSLEAMLQVDLGGPLHSLIIPGSLQPLESEYLAQYTV